MKLAWYAARLRRMSALEIALRANDAARKAAWRSRHLPGARHSLLPSRLGPVIFATPLSRLPAIPPDDPATRALVAAADRVMAGHWAVFGRPRADLAPSPDWFRDGGTDFSASRGNYSFDIDWRQGAPDRDVKRVWELSRHHHLTLLAAAYTLTGENRYAERIAEHLLSWWQANPFLSGIHWTMGIEVGMRLIAWVWIRRLLQSWSDAPALFERNPLFLRQLYGHQLYLARFRSHSSSANNHLLAEAAGLFAASCAFRGFAETDRWRAQAMAVLRREIPRQTFTDGVNRELATDYHLFVLELALTAMLEGYAAGFPLGRDVWRAAQAMTDAMAAWLDANGNVPRQGDSDDCTALLLDAPAQPRPDSLLATGASLFTAAPWWPPVRHGGLRAAFWAALAPEPLALSPRPAARPSLFPDAGMAFLRGETRAGDEIWCRCDHGPHGLLPLAAHAHADALSVELRIGGVEILADPGTGCYQSEPRWRDYFRSTLAHNTIELDDQEQSVAGGMFLWLKPARSRLIAATGLDGGPVAEWQAAHDGYRRLPIKASHERSVRLDRADATLAVLDRLDLARLGRCRLAFHFGPAVEVRLEGSTAWLGWSVGSAARWAQMTLPAELTWSLWRGSDDPPLGWYSAGFGRRQPAWTLMGEGAVEGRCEFLTRIAFDRGPSNGHDIAAGAAAGRLASSTSHG
ncbi:MAG TPA: alginate lyase family protein [Hypericibacter adhaerens]|uniref:heparinase II/III family protein n=1 Tax=Hypericibacter adhaerens TaxID=2602016 RepID=UPI002BDC17C8|nr:alginate lyase family protein [Hypericibacter adhaerens]HWA42732.1 alginate lyase family protein [Hypericibacter adhaerens]